MEIETKFQLSPEREAQLVARLGDPEATVAQRDVYLKTAGLPVALRVRQDGDEARVTLKSGFTKVQGIRVRDEWEPTIDPAELATWLTIFERLGFPAGTTVEKTRRSWSLPGGVHCLLDTLEGVGTFCEVEVVADEPKEALQRLEVAIADLGLADLPRLTSSYRDLVKQARQTFPVSGAKAPPPADLGIMSFERFF
jgi:predicted adenylyl cyclase CyaB